MAESPISHDEQRVLTMNLELAAVQAEAVRIGFDAAARAALLERGVLFGLDVEIVSEILDELFPQAA